MVCCLWGGHGVLSIPLLSCHPPCCLHSILVFIYSSIYNIVILWNWNICHLLPIVLELLFPRKKRRITPNPVFIQPKVCVPEHYALTYVQTKRCSSKISSSKKYKICPMSSFELFSFLWSNIPWRTRDAQAYHAIKYIVIYVKRQVGRWLWPCSQCAGTVLMSPP